MSDVPPVEGSPPWGSRAHNDDAQAETSDSDDVRVSRETLHRLYGATRLHVENDGECFTQDVEALREAERVLEKDGPYREDRCSKCRNFVDPEDHVGNPETGEAFCSADCWAAATMGDDE